MSTITMILIIILLLLLGVIGFLLMNYFSMNEKLKKLNSTNQKVKSLSILQNFMEIAGDNFISSAEKMSKVNEILIEKYEIKYSTIVMFNGIRYEVQASNVNEKHWEMFENLQSQDIFMESIKNATPKYITVNSNEKLPYLDMEFDRAKSALFFPMYIDNIYIGYWLIEGSKSHEFDKIDTTILEVIRKNIIAVVKCLRSQKILEKIPKIDEVTNLHTYEYLYGVAKKTIDKYQTSIVSLIKIINLQQIEEKISKKTADLVLKKIAEYISASLSPEYFCVKYDENEIAIVFSGSDLEGVTKFSEDLKFNIEKFRIKTIGSLKETMNGLNVAPKLNIVLKKYYKETALEEVLNSLVDYLNEATPNESDISCL